MRARSIRIVGLAIACGLLAGTALAGSITGTVKYEGRVPKLRPLAMDADPGCAKKHSGPVPSEMLVLGDGQTLGNVFVRITSGAPAKTHTPPSEAAVLDQKGCRYSPHVLGLIVGQTLMIKNSDGLLHNVHALPKVNKSFNRAMPANVTEFEYKFDKEEFMFKIKCDVHPWMGAYIGVLSHPYFDVTAKDGKFKIDGLPDGSYEVEVWHEKLKTKTQKVTISGGSGSADFVFTAPSKG